MFTFIFLSLYLWYFLNILFASWVYHTFSSILTNKPDLWTTCSENGLTKIAICKLPFHLAFDVFVCVWSGPHGGRKQSRVLNYNLKYRICYWQPGNITSVTWNFMMFCNNVPPFVASTPAVVLQFWFIHTSLTRSYRSTVHLKLTL